MELPMPSSRPVYLYIATPCFGGVVYQRYMQAVCVLMQHCAANGVGITVDMIGHDPLLTRARNTLVARFMDHQNATHLLFVDSDIGFEVRQIQRFLAFDRDVMAGMYPMKADIWDDAALDRVRAGEPCDTAAYQFAGTPTQPLRRSGAFVAADFAGTGFMMIKREAIARLFTAYPQLRYRGAHNTHPAYVSPHQYALFDCTIDEESNEYISEDYAFCLRWRKIGGEIWLDTEGRMLHVGPKEFCASPAIRFSAPER
jgi:hypothetical protein